MGSSVGHHDGVWSSGWICFEPAYLRPHWAELKEATHGMRFCCPGVLRYVQVLYLGVLQEFWISIRMSHSGIITSNTILCWSRSRGRSSASKSSLPTPSMVSIKLWLSVARMPFHCSAFCVNLERQIRKRRMERRPFASALYEWHPLPRTVPVPSASHSPLIVLITLFIY